MSDLTNITSFDLYNYTFGRCHWTCFMDARLSILTRPQARSAWTTSCALSPVTWSLTNGRTFLLTFFPHLIAVSLFLEKSVMPGLRDPFEDFLVIYHIFITEFYLDATDRVS